MNSLANGMSGDMAKLGPASSFNLIMGKNRRAYDCVVECVPFCRLTFFSRSASMNYQTAIALSIVSLITFPTSTALSQCETCNPPTGTCTNYSITIGFPTGTPTLKGGGTTQVCGCVNWFSQIPAGCSKGTQVTVVIQNQTTCSSTTTMATLPGNCNQCNCGKNLSEYCIAKAPVPAGTTGTKGLIIAYYYLASSLADCTSLNFKFQ